MRFRGEYSSWRVFTSLLSTQSTTGDVRAVDSFHDAAFFSVEKRAVERSKSHGAWLDQWNYALAGALGGCWIRGIHSALTVPGFETIAERRPARRSSVR